MTASAARAAIYADGKDWKKIVGDRREASAAPATRSNELAAMVRGKRKKR